MTIRVGSADHPRILFLRPDHLGDILLTFPAVCALRAVVPQAHIGYLVPEGLEDAARLCPAIDCVHGVRFPDLTEAIDGATWAGSAALIGDTLQGQYDVALLPRPDDPWSGPIAASAGIPYRFGFDLPSTCCHLTVPVSLPAERHVVHLALALVSSLLGTKCRLAPRRGQCIKVGDEDDVGADRLLAGVTPRTGRRPIVIHPGSGWPIKNWAPSRWGVLACSIQRRFGVQPLVVGTPREVALVDAVLRASRGNACMLPGPISIGTLAALHRRAQLVISCDSGALHLAALLGTPVVGLYGPADPAQFAPLLPHAYQRIVRVTLPCSPCGTLLDPPCGASSDPRCMSGIAVDRVLEAVSDVLKNFGEQP